jgi:hypothetical protein
MNKCITCRYNDNLPLLLPHCTTAIGIRCTVYQIMIIHLAFPLACLFMRCLSYNHRSGILLFLLLAHNYMFIRSHAARHFPAPFSLRLVSSPTSIQFFTSVLPLQFRSPTFSSADVYSAPESIRLELLHASFKL